MVAPNYSAQRSETAKSLGLGSKREEPVPEVKRRRARRRNPAISIGPVRFCVGGFAASFASKNAGSGPDRAAGEPRARLPHPVQLRGTTGTAQPCWLRLC